MDDFFKIVAAGPAFFVSAWVLMICAGIVGVDAGIRPFGYVTSMVVTIGLWLTLAPAMGAISRIRKKPCGARADSFRPGAPGGANGHDRRSGPVTRW